MIAIPPEAIEALREAGLTGLLVFLRVGTAILLLPAFGDIAVPRRVRLAVALAFTLVTAPAAAPAFGPGSTGNADALGLMLTETATGLALGFVLRLAVIALVIAGTIVAQATALAQSYGVPGAEPMPAASHLMVAAGLTLATLAGLHVQVAQALILSYSVLPPGHFPDAAAQLVWALGHADSALAVAFSIALPFLAGALVYNLAIGVINRAMPQLLLSLVGAPALSLAALALMTLALPTGLAVWTAASQAVLADPLGAAPGEEAGVP
ncbi:MAG: flagellar biosynthetic protein FliR [Paracoccaceae bacterium]